MNVLIRAQADPTDVMQHKSVRVDGFGGLIVGGSWVSRAGIQTTAPAYVQWDVLGGQQTITPPTELADVNANFFLDSLSVEDPLGLNADLLFLFFVRPFDVTGLVCTDNGGIIMSAGARSAFLGKQQIIAADYSSIDGIESAATIQNLNMKFISDALGKVYVVIVKTSGGTTNYGAGTGLYVAYGMRKA